MVEGTWKGAVSRGGGTLIRMPCTEGCWQWMKALLGEVWRKGRMQLFIKGQRSVLRGYKAPRMYDWKSYHLPVFRHHGLNPWLESEDPPSYAEVGVSQFLPQTPTSGLQQREKAQAPVSLRVLGGQDLF